MTEWIVTGINPEPWKSPEVSVGRKGGKLAPLVYKRESLRQFQEALHEELLPYGEQDGFPLTHDLEVTFYFWRQLENPKSQRADATNLVKSAEDALHGILFENDRQNTLVTGVIVDQAVEVVPTIIIQFQPRCDHTWIDRIKKLRNKAISIVRPPQNQRPAGFDPEAFF